MSDRRIIGPGIFDVDWDLPEQDGYWLPAETNIRDVYAIAETCGVAIQTGVSHHIPFPPQYSVHGLRFVPPADDTSRICVIERTGAVPQLTMYPKRS